MFKIEFPKAKLSLEQNTENVPHDNFFYLIKNGQILGKYKSRKIAEQKYKELAPKPRKKKVKTEFDPQRAFTEWVELMPNFQLLGGGRRNPVKRPKKSSRF